MDVNERWVIRHRLQNGRATDVVGWIEVMTDGQVSLRDRSERLVVIERPQIVVARRAPPAAGGPGPSRTSPDELEQVALGGWAAKREALGQWTLRAGGGFTGRANSCLAVGDPGMPLPEAAARIIEYAREHGIAPRAQVVDGSAPEAHLRAVGWFDVYVRTDVLASRLSSVLGEAPPNPQVAVTEVLHGSWLAAYQISRPNTADPADVRQVIDGIPPRAFGSIAVDGGIVAIGRAHLSGTWVGLASIWTAPEHRSRGWATAVIRALGHWAARRGARNAYLQVAAANPDAQAAYARLGFSHHHSYRYLAPPPEG